MKSLFALAGVLLAVGSPVQAQSPVADLLAQVKTLYARLEVERALPLLRQILSPAAAMSVTPAERVEAHTYLGAVHALMGQRDSAVASFGAALDWDPFMDLPSSRFTPGQIELFVEARRRTFAVALGPITPRRADPRSDAVPFTLVTTHAARVRAELTSSRDTVPVVLWAGDSDGLRQISWNALDRAGRLAAPGRYRVRVVAESRLSGRADSAVAHFDLSYDGPLPEDTLPAIAPSELLPEQWGPKARRFDLLKGLAVAAGALFIAGVLVNDDLGGGDGPAGVMAGAAVLTGAAALVLPRGDDVIEDNVAENRRRRDERRAANEAIRARNLERLNGIVLIVAPAAGLEP